MLSQVDPLGDTSIGPQASKAANVAPVRHGHRCVRRNAAAPDLDRWLCPIACAAQLVSSALRQPEFPERGATPRLLECGPVPSRPSPPSRIATCRLPSVDRHFDVATGWHSTARSRSRTDSAASRSQYRDTLRPAACGPAQCELRRVCYAAETVQVVASAAVRLCRRLASPGVAWQRPESQGPIRCGHVPWPGTRDPCSCWPLVGRVDLQSRPLALVTVDSCPTPLSLMLAPVWPRPSSGCPSAATPARAV
jgi:hypothetical protein